MNITPADAVDGSSCNSIPSNPSGVRIGQTFALCFIFVVSLVGNSFIGVIVFKTRTMRKPINFLIANMAISDLLYPIFWFPLKITHLYVDSWLISGPGGQALCKLLHFFPDVSTVVSIQSLVLIAVDRFGAVVFPLRSPLISSKLCPFYIFATWIVTMAVHAPYLSAFRLVEYPGRLACERRWNEAFGEFSSFASYYLALTIVFLFIPIVLLAILYSIILVKLKTQVFPGETSVIAQEHHARRNRNVLRMAIAIVFVFVICWVPFSTIVLLRFFEWERRSDIPCGVLRFGYTVALYLAHSNCAFNPLICFIFSANYRQGLKRLLKCFGVVQE